MDLFRAAMLCLLMIGAGSIPLHAQRLCLRSIAILPPELPESSGLIAGKEEGEWWSLNDGGNAPELICFDEKGRLLRKLKVLGATNVDWEELTANGSHAFIGDFGNNANVRRDLVIHRIPHPDGVDSDSASAETIRFTFPDQLDFPPSNENLKFDLEAMVVLRDTLHLFTKNRTSPFDGWVRHYALPASPGTFVATKVDSFFTGGGGWMNGSVTGAALSPDGKSLAFVGYKRLWLFSGFKGANFFSGEAKSFKLRFRQREAVAWLSGGDMYFTEEKVHSLQKAKLQRATNLEN